MLSLISKIFGLTFWGAFSVWAALLPGDPILTVFDWMSAGLCLAGIVIVCAVESERRAALAERWGAR